MLDPSASTTPELISLENVTLRIRERRILQDTTWQIRRGEHWALIGPNGSGKTTLLRALTGDTPVVAGHIHRAGKIDTYIKIGYVGPEVHRRFLQRDARTEILWSPVASNYPQTTPRTILKKHEADPDLARYFMAGLGIAHLTDRPIRTLSTGEMRKTLLAATVAGKPDLLLLDEPFDGLDTASVAWFADSLSYISGQGITFVLAAHRGDELAGPLQYVLGLGHGRVTLTGRFDDLVDSLPLENERVKRRRRPAAASSSSKKSGKVLVDFKKVRVRYDSNPVFEDLSWKVREGEHWCISGPNGSGKTTILNLICGDNLQAYANDIRLFGRKRGSGESIWDIKSDIGYITPYLSARYDKSMPVRSVIVSGFFDSIGLYKMPSESQLRLAEKAAVSLGIGQLLTRRFDRISAGERMTVLIARALVKEPKLLILDEPCQGLDREHRQAILDAVDRAGADGTASIIYVTHRQDEIPDCINQYLTLEPRKAFPASLG